MTLVLAYSGLAFPSTSILILCLPDINPINTAEDERNIIRYGQNHDGYWDSEDVVEATKQAVEIIRLLHPGFISLF